MLLGDRLVLYKAIVRIAAQNFVTYRYWVIAGAFVQLVTVAITYAYWNAVYGSTDVIAGLPRQTALNYMILAQNLSFILISNFRLIINVGSLIRDGGIAVELVRPLDLQERFLVQTFTESILELIFKVPVLLLSVLIFGLKLNATFEQYILFFVSMSLGLILLFLFGWIFACLAFFTTEVWGLSLFYESVTAILGGVLLPITLLPPFLYNLAKVSPFSISFYNPISLLSGASTGSQGVKSILIAMIYIIILMPISRLIFSLSLRRVTVQGG